MNVGSSTYCALLRGIGPGNPNQRNEKLRPVIEGLGFTNVTSVLASGNIVFSTDRSDVAALETDIQNALHTELQIAGGTIVRSQDELIALLKTDPFEGLQHRAETYLTATFFKDGFANAVASADLTPLESGRLVGYDAAARCALVVSDNSSPKTNVMVWLKKNFGKDITTRTWLTIQRIVNKMNSADPS